MNINRRGFLWLASACAAGIVLDPKLSLASEPTNVLLTKEWMAAECAKALKQYLGDWKTVYVPAPRRGRVVGARRGDRVHGVTMDTERYVLFSLVDGYRFSGADSQERFRNGLALPAGEALAKSLRHAKVRTLTDRPAPAYVEAVQASSVEQGVAVRLALRYEPERDLTVVRVDVLGSTQVAA